MYHTFFRVRLSPLSSEQIRHLSSMGLVKSRRRRTDVDVILGYKTFVFRVVAASDVWLLTLKFKSIKV